MKSFRLWRLAALLLLSPPAFGADFINRTVGYLSAGDARPCAFFQLEGVSEAVPAVPGSPWFVLPNAHPHFKEAFALLTVAKLTGRLVTVTTTGGVHPCGHAEVVWMSLP